MSESPESIIRLPTFEEQDHVVKTLQEKFKGVSNPSELEAARRNAGMSATLLNFHLATLIDLSAIGLGIAVHIPVEVTEREGGRKSVYSLDQGEEALTGICTTHEGIAMRFVKRVTGSSVPAEKGDIYSVRITNRDGDLVFEGQEVLQEFDPQAGEGHFGPLPDTERSLLTAAASPHHMSTLCLLWSTVVHQPNRRR